MSEGSDDDDESGSGHSSVMQESDDDLFGIIGQFSGHTKTKSASKGAGKPKPGGGGGQVKGKRASTSTAASSSGAPPQKVPRRETADAPRGPQVAEKEGSEVALDAESYLQQNGCDEAAKNFGELLSKFVHAKEFTCLDSADKAVAGALKAFSNDALSQNKAVIALFWKINKRKNVPSEVLDIMKSLKERVANFMALIACLAVKDLDRNADIIKINRAIEAVNAAGPDTDLLNAIDVYLPLKFAVMLYTAAADQFVTTGKFDDLRQHLLVPVERNEPQCTWCSGGSWACPNIVHGLSERDIGSIAGSCV